MSLIARYQPEFVRRYLSHTPHAPEQVSMQWQTEIRDSLLLGDIACCAAALGSPDAFTLHVSRQPADPRSPRLAARDAVLNQAALDVITLPRLCQEQRLYSLGVMLSYAEKQQGDDQAVLAHIAALPQTLAQYAEQGLLQEQYAQLPALPQLQRQLLTRLGGCDFDWDRLPDSPRKLTLPLQVNLLMLQDANSEALLHQQLQEVWRNSGESRLQEAPWIMSNYLIYRLYHEFFPAHGSESVLCRYLHLATDYFLIRTLIGLWLMDGSPLGDDEIFALFALFERWRLAPQAAEFRRQLLSSLPGDELLSAFSLLTR